MAGEIINIENSEDNKPEKRKRGRPRKIKTPEEEKEPKKIGRPIKYIDRDNIKKIYNDAYKTKKRLRDENRKNKLNEILEKINKNIKFEDNQKLLMDEYIKNIIELFS